MCPSGLLHVHLLAAFFWNCVFMILKLFDVAHSTSLSPLSLRWPRPKHPVALSDVFVCPPTFALKSPVTIYYGVMCLLFQERLILNKRPATMQRNICTYCKTRKPYDVNSSTLFATCHWQFYNVALCVRACACVRARVCVLACVRACVHACVRACVCE